MPSTQQTPEKMVVKRKEHRLAHCKQNMHSNIKVVSTPEKMMIIKKHHPTHQTLQIKHATQKGGKQKCHHHQYHTDVYNSVRLFACPMIAAKVASVR